MTLYIVEITVPANTPESNPIEVKLEIEEDIIVKVECRFYAGCCGMVKTACFYGQYQLFPRPAGTYLAGDDETISWSEYIILPHVPCTLTFKAWSPGTAYDHTIVWRIVALPKVVAMWWIWLEKFINILAKLFRVKVEI